METETKRIAPALTDLDEASVAQWAKDFEAYVKRGGKRRPRDCIDADVLVAVAVCDVAVETQGDTPAEKEADDERFMRELRALYSAPDADSARAVLSAVTLSGELRIDSVTKYVLEFTKAVAAHQVAATALGEGSVKDIFLRGIEQKVVRERAKGLVPATWQAAAKDLMRRAREHEQKVKEVELLRAAPGGTKKANTKARSSVPADNDDDMGSGVHNPPGLDTRTRGLADARKCYKCGETGHQAKDCGKTGPGGAGASTDTKEKETHSLIQCFKCGGYGHYRSNCTAPPRKAEGLPGHEEGRARQPASIASFSRPVSLGPEGGASGSGDEAPRR